MTNQINVSPLWFKLIKDNGKTVEGRLDRGRFKKWYIGMILRITCGSEFLRVKVSRITRYESLKEYLEQEGMRNCIPGVKDVKVGVKIYRQFYTKDDEKNGILAVVFQR